MPRSVSPKRRYRRKPSSPKRKRAVRKPRSVSPKPKQRRKASSPKRKRTVRKPRSTSSRKPRSKTSPKSNTRSLSLARQPGKITIDREYGDSYDLWQSRTVLGQGTFGTVYRATAGEHCRPNLHPGQVVALKEILLRKHTSAELDNEAVEVHLWNTIGHCDSESNDCALVPVLDAYYTGEYETLLIVFKIIDGLDGAGLIKEALQSGTDLDARRQFVSQYASSLVPLVSTLKRMHSLNVIHRDLKPPNLLWERSSNRFYIADLGAACDLHACMDVIFSVGYADPEKLYSAVQTDMNTFNAASDVYGLGMTLYSMLTLARPLIWPTEKPIPSDLSEAELIESSRELLEESRREQRKITELYSRDMPHDSVYYKLLTESWLMTERDARKRTTLARVLKAVGQ